MRAFIFSLDAFVAFSLALIAIYSLIFFSSIPSSYYFLLTQGHYLSRDALMTVTTSPCTLQDCIGTSSGTSILDTIIYYNDTNVATGLQDSLIQDSVGNIIPPQFGYSLEISKDGQAWTTYYDTSTLNDPQGHSKGSNKLTVSSQVITFGYNGPVNKKPESIYNYNTCHGGTGGADGGLITCGTGNNFPPENRNGGSPLVPSANARIVKLTVFI